jgi:hypothetical protein
MEVKVLKVFECPGAFVEQQIQYTGIRYKTMTVPEDLDIFPEGPRYRPLGIYKVTGIQDP